METNSERGESATGLDVDNSPNELGSEGKLQYINLPKLKDVAKTNIHHFPEEIEVIRPRVAKAVNIDWDGFRPESLLRDPDLYYPPLKEKREPEPSPPLIDPLLEEKRECLIKLLMNAPADTVDKFINLAAHEVGGVPPELLVADLQRAAPGTDPAPRPVDAPPSASKTAPKVAASFDAAAEPGAPRWPGRKSKSDPSPVDWLKAHFGRMVGDEWDGMGLTFAMLSKREPALALAYSRWIEKNPLDTLPIAKQPHTRRSDGEQKVSPPSFWKPTSELTPEQQEARRAYEAAKKRKIKVSNSL